MNITTEFQTFAGTSLAPVAESTELIDEVRRGLSKHPRSLVPWMLYDAEGSRLFECITTLPEYYPTRTERDIFARRAAEIVAAACSQGSRPFRLLELGAGTAAKTGILLEAAARSRNELIYIPVDVSPDALDAACASIGCLLPDVQLQPMVSNYVTHPPRLERFEGTTLALYIGSSIGNFLPEEARAILRDLRSELRPGDALLLGTDMVKDESDSRASVRRRCWRHRSVQFEHSASPQSRARRELRYGLLPASGTLESRGVTHRDASGEHPRSMGRYPGRGT